MKAVRAQARGGPEQLVVEEAPRPEPGAGEALVRVHASAITPQELGWEPTWKSRTGEDRRSPIPGHEISGVVEEVGSGVAGVSPGEAVYALTDFYRDGGDAEYVVVGAAVLAPRPRSLSHEEAAAVPLSALTAWQALFDRGELRRGQRVLVHAAAGGVGTFAVQLAHWHGAFVIGTSSARNVPFLQALGCDEVIDYQITRFEDVVDDCELVVDAVGGETLARSFSAVRRGGRLISIVEPPSQEKALAYDIRASFFIVEPSRPELVEIGRLIDEGRIRPIVAEIFPLDHARQAFERGLLGHNRGKLVLRVAGP
jgi:NADPH:quinone reductase-like Zn-dependent oxidoreductase